MAEEETMTETAKQREYLNIENEITVVCVFVFNLLLLTCDVLERLLSQAHSMPEDSSRFSPHCCCFLSLLCEHGLLCYFQLKEPVVKWLFFE